jgi:hypothetical protein
MGKTKEYYEQKLEELKLSEAVKTSKDALKKFREKLKKG